MTNIEKYLEEIIKIKGDIAVVKGKPCACSETNCYDCDLSLSNIFGYCTTGIYIWLASEYKEEVKNEEINEKS